MESISLGLYVDESDPACSLLAFPIIMQTTSEGKKVLQPQVRINRLGSISIEGVRAMFINTYGFIEERPTERTGFFQPGEKNQQQVVTAGMLTLGQIRTNIDPDEIGEACLRLKVNAKKSAASEEKIVFSILEKPPALMTAPVVQDGGLIAKAEGSIKCPGKMMSEIHYSFRVMFVSITMLDNQSLYRVPTAISSFKNKALYSIQLEVLLEVDVKPESPQCKFLADQKGKKVASVWFHLCNSKKTNASGKPRSLEDMRKKVRDMGIKVSLADLWGPTIIVRATGKMSKYMLGFFSTSGTSCHPVTKSSPDLAKILWSCSSTIIKANAIVQGSVKVDVLTLEDIQVSSAAKINKSGIGKFNPFKK
ncbi:matrix protein [avian paramyxovirus 7]|uniref:Matrix protein n=1 Tax=avian paramyxovirus 7 TaxID=2560317 RepID=C6FGY8_9MONO|nr:matrix protein [Avian metaavulavirus 7]ACN72642.1 matrix protein [Avian metaavulavirus 7]